jgi:hypothetical protein
MALHVKWSSGDQIWYDGTQEIMRVQDDDEGIIFGMDDEGVDVKFFGDTTGAHMLWDESDDALEFEGGASIEMDDGDITLGDKDYVKFGDAPDVTMRWTSGGVFELLPAAAFTDMNFGSTDKPLDIVNYGNIRYRAPAAVTSTGTATITLTSTSNRIQFLDAAGNFLLIVPTSSGAGVAGMQFTIFNCSTGTISVQEGSSGGTAVATITKDEGAILVSNSTDWKAIIGSS